MKDKIIDKDDYSLGFEAGQKSEKRMSKKKWKGKPEFVYDHDEAFKLWNPPVQCGDCYVWYDPRANRVCPICGGDEWVGSR